MLRYLYRLEGLHAEDGNVTERGYTLQMLSKQYTVSIGQTSVSVLSNPTQIVNTMNFVSRPMRVRTFLFIFHNVLLEAISHLILILFFSPPLCSGVRNQLTLARSHPTMFHMETFRRALFENVCYWTVWTVSKRRPISRVLSKFVTS